MIDPQQAKFFPGTWLNALLLLLMSFLLISPIVLFLMFYFPSLSHDLLGVIVFMLLFIAVLSIVYVKNRRQGILVEYSFSLRESSWIPLLMALIVVFQIGIEFPTLRFLEKLFHINEIPSNPFNNIIFVVGAVLLGPLVEEFIFRGIILKGLLENYSPLKAVTISAVIFSLSHGVPLQMLGALAFGLLFGLVYFKTRSLGMTIILHSFANASAIVGQFAQYKIDFASTATFVFTIFLITISILFFIVLFRRLWLVFGINLNRASQ